jgi:hypothetical protein
MAAESRLSDDHFKDKSGQGSNKNELSLGDSNQSPRSYVWIIQDCGVPLCGRRVWRQCR